jgi:hypothetical protein
MIRIFVCYSRQTKRWTNPEVRTSLIPFLDKALGKEVEVWWDQQIPGGAEWRKMIEDRIDTAHIALLLVSQEFLYSDFIREVELPRIERRMDEDGLVVMPILVGHCEWKNLDRIVERQILPGGPEPLIEYVDSEARWEKVRLEILTEVREKVESLQSLPDPPMGPRDPDGPGEETTKRPIHPGTDSSATRKDERDSTPPVRGLRPSRRTAWLGAVAIAAIALAGTTLWIQRQGATRGIEAPDMIAGKPAAVFDLLGAYLLVEEGQRASEPLSESDRNLTEGAVAAASILETPPFDRDISTLRSAFNAHLQTMGASEGTTETFDALRQALLPVLVDYDISPGDASSVLGERASLGLEDFLNAARREMLTGYRVFSIPESVRANTRMFIEYLFIYNTLLSGMDEDRPIVAQGALLGMNPTRGVGEEAQGIFEALHADLLQFSRAITRNSSSVAMNSTAPVTHFLLAASSLGITDEEIVQAGAQQIVPALQSMRQLSQTSN